MDVDPVDRVVEHLEDALESGDPAEKNYHVRSALQELDFLAGERDDPLEPEGRA